MQRLTGFLNPDGRPERRRLPGDPGEDRARLRRASSASASAQSLQKAFYLPEAHTDMIAAVIGEELGLVGIAALVGLFGLFGYAGLRTAQRATDRYGKLLAAGLTSLILVQAIVNLFAVLGLAPLTGVPLPFVSYGNSSLLVMLAAVRAAPQRRPTGGTRRGSGPHAEAALRDCGSSTAVEQLAAARAPPQEGSATSRAKSRDSRGRNRGTRRAGAGRRRRASR